MVDLAGSTLVYVSRTNPHPYKYDNDIAFDLSTQKEKIIVISANTGFNMKRRSIDDELTREIYVSVTSDTESTAFKIEAKECDPLNCTGGTNEIPTTQPPITRLPTTAEPDTTTARVTTAPRTTTAAPTTTATTPESSAGIAIATNFVVVSLALLTMSL